MNQHNTCSVDYLIKLILIISIIAVINEAKAAGKFNITPDTRPTDLEYAELSTHVYKGNSLKVGHAITIAGNTWQILDIRKGENSYFAAIYANHASKELILVHRGTDSFGAVVDDIEGVVLNLLSAQHTESYKFTQDAVDLARSKNYHLSTTGHSLGALLAELSVYYCHDQFNYEFINAVTFESPGSRDIMEKRLLPNLKSHNLEIDKLDIIQYVSYPNLINTSRPHVGTLYQLQPMLGDVGWVWGWYTKQSHSMENIVTMFRQGNIQNRRTLMKDWPLGSEKSKYFKAYRFEDGKYKIKEVEQSKEFELYYKGHYVAEAHYNSNTQCDLRHFSKHMRLFLTEFFNKHGSLFITDEHRTTLIEYWHKQGIPLNIASMLAHYNIDTYRGKPRINLLNNKWDIESFRRELSVELSQNLATIKKALFKPLSVQKNEAGQLIVIQGDAIQAGTYIKNFVYNSTNAVKKKKENSAIAYHLSPRNSVFSGRKLELKKISNNFNKLQSGIVIQTIVGAGGTGKSMLTNEYAYRSIGNKDYDIVLWIAAETNTSINQSYLGFARKMQINDLNIKPETIRNIVHSKLLHSDNIHKILLILDNVPDKKYIQKYLIEINETFSTDTKFDILITSRSQFWKHNKIFLNVFTKDEANEFIKKSLPNEENKYIVELAALLNYYPLAIEHAIAYIQENTNIEDYLQLYKNRQKKYLSISDYSMDEYKKSVWQTLAVSLESLSQDAKDILFVSAYLDPDYIALALLKDIFQLNKCSTIEKQNECFRHLGTEKMYKAIHELRGKSLITLINNNKSIKIHRILQEVLRLKVGEDASWVKKIIKYANNAAANFTELDKNTWKVVKDWMQHIPIIVRHHDNSLENIKMLHKYGSIAIFANLYTESHALYSAALKLQKDYYPDFTNINYVETLLNLGWIKMQLGDYRTSENMLKNSLTLVKKHYGTKSPQYVINLNKLGVVYCELGDYTKSKELLEQALKIKKEIFEPEHIEIAYSLQYLGVVYCKLGNYTKSKELLEQALEIRKKTLGSEHIETAYSLQHLGVTYCKLGNYTKSKELLEQALKIKKEALGLNHIETVYSLYRLGITYRELGDYTKSKELLEQALETQTTHARIPSILLTYFTEELGKTYCELGNYTKSKELLEQALKVKKEILGSEHIETAYSLHNLGVTYCKLGNYTKSKELLEQALEIKKEVFGSEHIETAYSLHNLGVAYRKLGNYTKSKELLEQALKIKKGWDYLLLSGVVGQL